jgi:hypothetical protein
VKLELELAEYDEQVQYLAKRSISILQNWYDIVEGFNECIAEWDDRLRELETRICRREKIEKEADVY